MRVTILKKKKNVFYKGNIDGVRIDKCADEITVFVFIITISQPMAC